MPTVLYIVDRSKDNHLRRLACFPREVEDVLTQHPAVSRPR
jgi:acyl-CoA synthetase (AMP-forming)/AMP-acid ligase II